MQGKGILGLCCSSCFAVNCYDKESMLREQRNCFVSQGLFVNMASEQLQNAVQNDPQAVCQEKDKYGAALRCALKLSRQCLIQLGQNPDIIPDADRAIEGINYVCNNYRNIDVQCVKDKNAAMQQCAIHKAREAFSGRLDVVNITCKAFKIASECLGESLASCSRQTVGILERYTDVYITPTACGNQYSANGGYSTTMAPVETFTLVTGMPSLPHAQCYSKYSIQSAQKRCYRNQGLHIVLPEITLGNGRKTKQTYLDALMLNSNDFKDMCRNKLGQYQRAMWCAMEVGRNCMPADYKDYVPSGRQVQELLVELCNNVDDINQRCVNSKASALFDCGFEKGQTLRGKSTKTLLCSAFRFTAVCQKRELYDCGCKTSSLYVQMSREHLNPAACAPIDVLPHRCNETTSEYIGSATQSAASVGLL
ncbi:hypothetical protein ACOMHN_042728 [Nucella lapillus]